MTLAPVASVTPIVPTGAVNPVLALLLAKHKLKRDLTGRYEFTVDVNKDLAAKMLELRDASQRNLARDRVAEIRNDIDNGRWENTGDPVRFSPDGTLVDGQHRLSAFVSAKDDALVIPDMTVVILKSKRSLDVVDTGKSRTVNDIRKMTGRTSVPARVVGGIAFEASNFDQKITLSKIEKNTLVDNCPYIDNIRALANAGGSTPVLAAAIRCMKKDEQAAFKFFSAAVANHHMVDDKFYSPLQVLATWLKEQTHSGGGHAIRRETVVRCIHAWNAFREGRELHHSRYYKKSDIPDAV
jgi:hypothetical protein